MSYVDNGEEIIATEANEYWTLTIIYDDVSQSLDVTYDDGDYQSDGTLTDFVPAESEDTPEVPAFIGTWEGEIGGINSISVTIVLKDDFTGTYNDTEFTFEVDGNVITAADEYGIFELTLTYDESSKSLAVSYYDTDSMVTLEGTLTDFTPFN